MSLEPVGHSLARRSEVSDEILSSLFPAEQTNTEWKSGHSQVEDINWSGTEGNVDEWDVDDDQEEDGFEGDSVEHDCVDGWVDDWHSALFAGEDIWPLDHDNWDKVWCLSPLESSNLVASGGGDVVGEAWSGEEFIVLPVVGTGWVGDVPLGEGGVPSSVGELGVGVSQIIVDDVVADPTEGSWDPPVTVGLDVITSLVEVGGLGGSW